MYQSPFWRRWPGDSHSDTLSAARRHADSCGHTDARCDADIASDADADAAPTPEPTIAPEEVVRMYEWTFNNQADSAYIGLLKSDYDLYKSRPHTRGSDYAGYKI